MAERRVFVDLEGLCSQPALAEEYAQALGLSGEPFDDRVELLQRLRDGAGVVVVTGPLGAPFWSLASIEVQIRVEPDGIDYDYRTTDETLWSLLSVGLTETEARALAAAYTVQKPPTPKHGQYARWGAADALRSRLRAAASASAPSIIVQAFAVDIRRDPADQIRLLDSITERAAVDWEWDTRDEAPIAVSVSTADRNFYLPLRALDFRLPDAQGIVIRNAVDRLVRRVPTIFHNGRSDLGTQSPGDPVSLSGRPIDDTLVMAFTAGERDLGLKPLTRKYFPDRTPMAYPMDEEGRGLERYSVELGSRYAAAGDTRNTFDLYSKLRRNLEQREQLRVYEDIERPLVPLVASMERYGSPVSIPEVKRLRAEHWEAEEAIRLRVLRDTGFDIGDRDQRRDYIKSKTGYDPGSLDKRGLAKWQGEWMDELIHPETGYQPYRTRRNNFLDRTLTRWTNAGEPEEFYVYPQFNQAGSVLEHDPRGFKGAPRTGRFSSSGSKNKWSKSFGAPQLQNQPRLLRAMFVAPWCPTHGCPGCPCPDAPVFWSLDYSQLELFVAAARSRDPKMLGTLMADGDLHEVFRAGLVERTGREFGRPAAKQGNFEQLYEGGIDKLVQILALQRIHIDRDIAKAIVEGHHEFFAGYHQYGEGVIAAAEANGGRAWSIDGRERYEADLFSKDAERAGWARRALVNMTIQGTAADIIKRAMGWLAPMLVHFGAHMSVQVHDELCGWVSRGNADAFIQAAKAVMVSVPLPGLRLKVSGGYGTSWSEAH
jgi:DNA polymerase I-like protein with 3'-5' exonuclease and polymerase domains